jgi:F-type H+-transporting ATPase subunit b
MHLWYAVTSTSSAGIPGLLSALGIDWRSLILDTLAFLITVAILGKYVYPILTKALDKKQAEIEAAARLEQEAKTNLSAAQVQITQLIEEAHVSADDIIATAKVEADELTKASNKRATAQAQRIVEEAHDELQRDIQQARQTLKSDTARLVAKATETILNDKLNATSDARLIEHSLEDSLRSER